MENRSSVKEDCGMRFSPHKSKSNTNCCVYGCKSYAKKDPTVRFHSLPKFGENEVTITNVFKKEEKMDRRTAWQLALKIDKHCSPHARVCSLHFSKDDYVFPDFPCSARKLKKSAVPSVNLPAKVFAISPICGCYIQSTHEKLPVTLEKEALQSFLHKRKYCK